jgi:polyisoprenoid-binding protein YceI
VTRAPTAGPAGDHSRIANHRLAPAPGVYAIEAVHTFVGFTAQHRVVGRVRGRVERVAGTVTIAEELIASSLEVTVETASISTPFVARDKDLRSDCFLDSDAHPAMTYRSTGVIELVLLTVPPRRLLTRFAGKPRAAFTASGTVTRSEFGLVVELDEEGGARLSETTYTLDIEAEATVSQ